MSIVEDIPIIGEAAKFARLAKNVHNCTDPIEASLKASKGILIDCLPPNIKYPLKCLALAAQVGIAVGGGASISVALSIALGNQRLEKQF
jgi:hypothetical protein